MDAGRGRQFESVGRHAYRSRNIPGIVTLLGVTHYHYSSACVDFECFLGAFVLGRFQPLLLFLRGLLCGICLCDFVSFIVQSQAVAGNLVVVLVLKSKGASMM